MSKQDKKDSVKFQMFKLFTKSDDFAKKIFNFSNEEVYDFAEFLMSLDDKEFFKAYNIIGCLPRVRHGVFDYHVLMRIGNISINGQPINERMISICHKPEVYEKLRKIY